MGHERTIIHLTDLHVKRWKSQQWESTVLEAIKNSEAEIVGIAVTGDVMNSPSQAAFDRAGQFFEQALKRACLERSSREPDWDLLWVVDGNHDRRWLGIVSDGLGGGAASYGFYGTGAGRREEGFTDATAGVAVFGLDSNDRGSLARGEVARKDLDRMRSFFDSADQSADVHRIVLLHHHPLPLPWNKWEENPIKDIKRTGETVLLRNSGSVLTECARCGVDLVLHGHKHTRFAASYRRLGGTYVNHEMAVVGGDKVADGYQEIRLPDAGGAELVGHRWEEGAYRSDKRVWLWTADEHARRRWLREAEEMGSYERYSVVTTVSAVGDLVEDRELRGIRGRRDPIDVVEMRSRPDRPTHTRVVFGEARGRGNGQVNESRDTRDEPKEVGLDVALIPPATRESAHDGFRVRRQSFNSFSTSQRDDLYRGPTDRDPGTEGYAIRVTHPTESLEVLVRLPEEACPDRVDVEAYRSAPDGGSRELDEPETARARRALRSTPEQGIFSFALPWAAAGTLYELSWDLKETEVDPEWGRYRIDDERHYAALAEADHAEGATLSTIIRRYRDLLLEDERFGAFRDSVPEKECLELAMAVFLEDHGSPHIRLVAGSHQEDDGGRWTERLPWGNGIIGTAMRRGKPLLHTGSGGPGLAITPDRCKLDAYYLAVPIALPPDGDVPAKPRPLQFYRAAICASSHSASSGLHRAKDSLGATDLHAFAVQLAAIAACILEDYQEPAQTTAVHPLLTTDSTTGLATAEIETERITTECVELQTWPPPSHDVARMKGGVREVVPFSTARAEAASDAADAVAASRRTVHRPSEAQRNCEQLKVQCGVQGP